MPRKKNMMGHLRDLKEVAGEIKNVANTVKQTVNAVGKNGASFKSAEAIYNGGRRVYNQSKHTRGHFVRAKKFKKAIVQGKRSTYRQRAQANAIQKGQEVMANAIMQQHGLANTKEIQRRFEQSDTTRGCLINHTELITPVYATDGVITPYVVPLAPAQAALNPFSSNLGRQYSKAIVHKMHLFYSGSCGTGQNGKIWAGVDFKVNTFDASIYNDSSAYAQLDNKPSKDGGCPVWGSCQFRVDVKSFAKGNDKTLTNYSGDVTSLSSDQEQYIGGYLIIGCDAPGSGVMGMFWISYSYEFIQARQPSPISDYYYLTQTVTNSSESNQPRVINYMQYLTQVSKVNLTSMKTAEVATGFVFSTVNSINFISTLYCTGGGFPTNNDDSDLWLFHISASTGSSVSWIYTIGGEEEFVISYYVTLIDNGYVYFNPNDGDITIDFMKITNTLSAIDVGEAVPSTSFINLNHNLPKYMFPPAFLSRAITHYERTGKKMPMHIVGGKKNRVDDFDSKYYYLSRDDAGESKYDETPEEVSKVPTRQVNSWVDPMLSNKMMHARNGNGLLGLLFLLVVSGECQQWPFKTTTKFPTFMPVTKYPSKSPTTIPPTPLPTTKTPTTRMPTVAPTDPTNSYSLIRFQGPFPGLLTDTVEMSDDPVVTVLNTQQFRYNGIHGYPVNLTICMFSTGVLSTWIYFVQDNGANPVEGTNSAELSLQNSILFVTVEDVTQRDFAIVGSPTLAPTPQPAGWIYVAKVKRHPDVDMLGFNFTHSEFK